MNTRSLARLFGIVTYRAGGRQLIGVASGMKSVVWPGGADKSRILVYGLR